MSADYKDLLRHKDHDVVIAWYGDKEDPDNVAIECEDCNEVLFDKNNPRVEDPDPQEELAEAIDTGPFETILKHAECDGVKILIRNGQAEIRCNDCDNVLYSAKE
jgi:ribosomal protein S27E